MSEYFLRSIKIQKLYEMLTPTLDGTIEDLAKMAHSAMSTKSPFPYAIDVNRAAQLTIKAIEVELIESMRLCYRVLTPSSKVVGIVQTLLQIEPSYLTTIHSVLTLLSIKVRVKAPKIRVMEVDGKGKGVVAMADIPANALVTFYPFDLIRLRAYDERLSYGKTTHFSPHEHFQDLILDQESRRPLENETNGRLDTYKFTIGNVDIYGDPNIHSSGCCGHMLNDGDGPTKGMNNCVFVPMFGGALIAVIAVFEIKKGSELLASYGLNYWRDRSN